MASHATPNWRTSRLRRGVRLIPAGKGGAVTFSEGVADGTRTRDHRDHNPGLYQLSYRHRVAWTE